MHLFWSNVFSLSVALLRHFEAPAIASDIRLREFLAKFKNQSSEEPETHLVVKQATSQETTEEFEEKKRSLFIMLDQSAMMKMKISKAFPERLAKLGPDFVINFLIYLGSIWIEMASWLERPTYFCAKY